MPVSSFAHYLKQYLVGKGAPYTHTRIGDKELGVFGGTYNIPDDKLDEFYDKYKECVIKDGAQEYLTEKQLENGPLLVDVDLRYDISVTKRLHNKEHIVDLIDLYLDAINKIMTVPKDHKMNIYVMEKSEVNMLEDKTKDGIHILFSINTDSTIQHMIRNEVLKNIGNTWTLPLTNTWDDVLDECITKKTTNWQLFGSRKPGHKSYMLSYVYEVSKKDDVDDWDIYEIKKQDFDILKNFKQLTARNIVNSNFQIQESMKNQYESLKQTTKNTIKKKKLFIKSYKGSGGGGGGGRGDMIDYQNISNEQELDELIENSIMNIDSLQYEIKETHLYTMALPIEYWGENSFYKWIRVGWALRNTNFKLFLTWIKFSSQWNKFSFSDVPDLFTRWCNFDAANPDGLTNRSIIYWCKQDSPDMYKSIRFETIDYFVQESIEFATDFDLANILYHIYKDRFVCVSIKNNVWYEYYGNLWREIDSGNTLRIQISKEMWNKFFEKSQQITARLIQLESESEEWKKLKVINQKISTISAYLKKTNIKNNIMREARELFYDRDFMEKMDSNPYLICFNNFVIDFKKKEHRKGRPEDYLSKCTNIDFITNLSNYSSVQNEILSFMEQLFPENKLNKYMWQHLASCLLGTNDNQTFNIYTGSGANGKSKLVELMARCMGDYKATVPITLITQKRNTIGSTSSEVAQLIGTRYAVMQEPSKGDKINEGIMKEITGGDPIQARALFKDSITFVPQFKLAVCTNTLFDIASNDDGTWRRIRVCPFKSKFTSNPGNDPKFSLEDYPYQFLIDKNLDEKFEKWAPVFAAMLVEMVYQTQGHVEDCDIVMASSNKYRDGQDYFSEFNKEKIRENPGGKIKKTELIEEFKQWYISHFNKSIPKGIELYEYMDKKYGKYKSGWHNISISYDD